MRLSIHPRSSPRLKNFRPARTADPDPERRHDSRRSQRPTLRPLEQTATPRGQPREIAQPWPARARQGRQPRHQPGHNAPLASPRPGAHSTDVGARHGPRHHAAVARPVRPIQRRAERMRHLIPIPLARSREARGILAGAPGRTSSEPLITTPAGESRHQSADHIRDLAALDVIPQILDGLRVERELPDPTRAGDTPVQGRGEIVKRRAAWRVGFPTPRAKWPLGPPGRPSCQGYHPPSARPDRAS